MTLTIDDKVRGIPYYPKAAAYGFEDGWLRLSSNENPFPPSQKVLSAVLEALPYMNRYPGGEMELKTAVAASHGLVPEEVLIGNGSNELIEMALRALKTDGRDVVIISEPSFAFYQIAAKVYGYEVRKAPVANMRVDLKALRNNIDDRTRIIFLNNPLNPTGTIFEDNGFEEFITSIPEEILIVADEAYAEFVENERFPRTIRWIRDFPVIVLRTFSKAYGLAGLRVGYGLGEKSLMSFLERTKQPFSINMIALIAARAALLDEAYLQRVLETNRKGKAFFYEAFKSMSLEYVPTEANFLLLKVGEHAEELTKKLFERKIVIRFMGAYSLPDYVRVTIGTMDENRRFIDGLKALL